MKQKEHLLQTACFNYFNLTYRKYKGLLFAIPNGGQRNIQTAAYLKKEGVVSGVADMFLSVPNTEYHGLYLEFKVDYNKQSESQKQFEILVTKQNYKYQIIKSVDEFILTIKNYLNNKELSK